MTTISLLRCGKKRWPRRGGDVAKGQKKHEPGGESRLMLRERQKGCSTDQIGLFHFTFCL